MQFLKRHYEKLALGLFLVGLLVGSWLLVKDLQEVGEGGEPPPELGNAPLHEALSVDVFDFEEVFQNPKLEWVAAGDPEEGDLFEPRKYIRCADPECLYLIPITLATCPYCRADQGPKTRGIETPKEGEDDDRDLLPNEFEAKHDFLDPNNPTDAGQDEDKDWFTNLEEQRAGTSLTEPKEHPPLATRLRFLWARRRSLNMTLKRVGKNRVDDPKKWDVFLNVLDRGKMRTRIKRIGDTVGESKLKIIAIRVKEQTVKDPRMGNVERKIDRSEIDLQREGDEEKTTLVVNRPGVEKAILVRLVLITDWRAAEPTRTWRQYEVRHDKPLVLEDSLKQKETYRIVGGTANSITVRKADAEGNPEKDAPEVFVRRLDRRRDRPRRSRRAAGRTQGRNVEEGRAGAPRGRVAPGEQGEAMAGEDGEGDATKEQTGRPTVRRGRGR